MDTPPLKELFVKTYETYSDAIFRYCLWKTSDREVALDIAQDTFMRFWDEVSQGKNIDNDKALLYTIARRLIIDYYRKKKSVSLDSHNEAFDEDPFETPDDRSLGQIEISAEARLIRDKIKILNPLYRQAVYLRFIEGLEPKEIANVLSISPNLAGVRIDRGLKELRELIDPKN